MGHTHVERERNEWWTLKEFAVCAVTLVFPTRFSDVKPATTATNTRIVATIIRNQRIRRSTVIGVSHTRLKDPNMDVLPRNRRLSAIGPNIPVTRSSNMTVKRDRRRGSRRPELFLRGLVLEGVASGYEPVDDDNV
ncbi:hypothetical protein R6Q57_015601 [Mikania cordata]